MDIEKEMLSITNVYRAGMGLEPMKPVTHRRYTCPVCEGQFLLSLKVTYHPDICCSAECTWKLEND